MKLIPGKIIKKNNYYEKFNFQKLKTIYEYVNYNSTNKNQVSQRRYQVKYTKRGSIIVPWLTNRAIRGNPVP